MKIRELSIPGAWEITPKQNGDSRGKFMEVFKEDAFKEATGRVLTLKQANCSTSAAGVVRGIHFADIPPSQAKYVMCPKGAVLDIAVDIRVGSPTFGLWDSVLLDDTDRRMIFLSEGIGHAFCSLEDDSTVMYLCSAPYAPTREHGINPLCPEVGIELPQYNRAGKDLKPLLSDKDTSAPKLSEAKAQGLLPTWEQYLSFQKDLKQS